MKKRILVSIILLGLFQACKPAKDKNEQVIPITENLKTDTSEDGAISIGNKTEDPHIMRYMKKAVNELAKKDERFSKISLQPNYKYVKIIPLNENGATEIIAMTNLDVYYFPLDYEITKHGKYYIDPEKSSSYNSFWVVAPIDFKFSENIKEKMIEEVFMPFGTGRDNFSYNKETEELYRSIEEKSYNTLYPSSKKARISVTYSGSIMVEDDTLTKIKYGASGTKAYLPLKGITVKARNLLTTNSTKTTASGSFIFNRNWLGSVDEYTIVWESTDFYLENWFSSLTPSAASSSYSSGIANTWNKKIDFLNFTDYRYAHIYRGAYQYYNLPAGDIMPPPRAGFIQTICNLRSQVAIRVRDGNQSTTRGINSTGCQSNVVIENTLPVSNGVFSEAGYKAAYPVFRGYYMFASISHELTHLKHWAMPGGMTDAKYCVGVGGAGSLAESYALMGEYHLVNKEYSSLLQIPYYWNSDNFDREGYQKKTISYWNNSTSSCTYNLQRYYTPYFIDLLDSRNQLSTNGIDKPNDQVSGYTAKFLEDCLKISPDNWSAINAKIKNPGATSPYLVTPPSVQGNTSANIDYLYNLYKSL